MNHKLPNVRKIYPNDIKNKVYFHFFVSIASPASCEQLNEAFQIPTGIYKTTIDGVTFNTVLCINNKPAGKYFINIFFFL